MISHIALIKRNTSSRNSSRLSSLSSPLYYRPYCPTQWSQKIALSQRFKLDYDTTKVSPNTSTKQDEIKAGKAHNRSNVVSTEKAVRFLGPNFLLSRNNRSLLPITTSAWVFLTAFLLTECLYFPAKSNSALNELFRLPRWNSILSFGVFLEVVWFRESGKRRLLSRSDSSSKAITSHRGMSRYA